MDVAVCRRQDDASHPWPPCDRGICKSCGEHVLVEGGLQDDLTICIHCAVEQYPDIMLFVELPPDEYGFRSIGKSIKEVYEAKNGEWHKDGVWHNQKWVLARQE